MVDWKQIFHVLHTSTDHLVLATDVYKHNFDGIVLWLPRKTCLWLPVNSLFKV